MDIAAIVPAYNEAPTVARVVAALRDAASFSEVVVVDDGSRDETAKIAAQSGARVVATPRNIGKGNAMLFAFRSLAKRPDRVAFFDADLIGLKARHVRRMVDAAKLGYDLVAGLRDKGPLQNYLQLYVSPLITGERIVSVGILDALPLSCWSGYCIETAINDVVRRSGGKTVLMFLDGVRMRTKSQKNGLMRGVIGHCRMAGQILRTREALSRTKGQECAL